MKETRLLSVVEVAQRVSRSERTIWRWVHLGLPVMRGKGHQALFEWDEVLRWVKGKS